MGTARNYKSLRLTVAAMLLEIPSLTIEHSKDHIEDHSEDHSNNNNKDNNTWNANKCVGQNLDR
eukprot:m.13557 g.13557  ORF g.13557 m.13557 type:complete len:64 (+) comp9773_c0_seq1:289-480(+)